MLHLGCGLDSRAFRLDVPETVPSCDPLDFPDVIKFRRRLYPEHAGYRLLASSATDPGWLDEIPVDRPALMVTEGVLPYLTAADVQQLFRRLTDRLPSGELIFKRHGVAGPHSTYNQAVPMEPQPPPTNQARRSQLALIDVVPVVRGFKRIPYRGYSANFQVMNKIQAMRNAMRLLRYRF